MEPCGGNLCVGGARSHRRELCGGWARPSGGARSRAQVAYAHRASLHRVRLGAGAGGARAVPRCRAQSPAQHRGARSGVRKPARSAEGNPHSRQSGLADRRLSDNGAARRVSHRRTARPRLVCSIRRTIPTMPAPPTRSRRCSSSATAARPAAASSSLNSRRNSGPAAASRCSTSTTAAAPATAVSTVSASMATGASSTSMTA